jgi:crotonobetainyl-CoA:carnitine CoA-transferase CaiB-like acyl-CoA transferase
MKIQMPHPTAGKGTVDLIGNPLKLSDTPIRYTKAPPMLGADTNAVLQHHLGFGAVDLLALQDAGVIEGTPHK